MDEGTVTVDGTPIHYLETGSGGTPVVLLHGGVIDCASLSWGGVLSDLAERLDRRVVAPDLAGYGDSGRPDADYSTAYHVGVVGRFLDEVGFERVSLVGLSLGGAVALGLALQDAGHVERLVLVDSYGLGSELPNGRLSWLVSRVPQLNRLSLWLLSKNRRLTRASLGGVVVDPGAVPDEVVGELFERLQEPRVGESFRRWRRAEITRTGYRTDYTDRFGELTVPTLLVHGAGDELFPVEWAERAARELPDARLEVFEDSAHWPPREEPGRFVATVSGFLS